jgi:proline iminopeptidase
MKGPVPLTGGAFRVDGGDMARTMGAPPTRSTPPGRWFARTRWPSLAIAVAVSTFAGWGTALLMPRGPITPAQVVVAMVVGAAIGGVAGFAMRSRWAILVAPLAFWVALEVGRIDVVGPSVDRPNVSTFFGVLVLVLGRGFHVLVQVAPMMIGAVAGVGLSRGRSRRRGWPAVAQWARRGVTAALTLALVVLAALLTRPGQTEPIVGADGAPVAGSVAELARVELGGHEQTVLLRGRSTADPVLLYLAGGPGQSDIGYARAYMTELEDDFVFAVWDQRGTGTSYAALDPTSTWTLDQAVSDTVELARYLRDRFGQEKIYLFGNSWGSTLGVLAVQRHPELFHAYIGAGQMVSQLESDQIINRQVLDLASRTGDTALAGRMREFGPPPYRDIYAYAFLIDLYDRIGPYERTAYFLTQGPTGIDGTGAVEYGPLDKVNKEKALTDMGAVMYPQLQGLDFRRQVPRLDVPVHLVMGAHELSARTDPAREWFDGLQAPAKQWITFDDSGHVPQFEEFPRFREELRKIVQETS